MGVGSQGSHHWAAQAQNSSEGSSSVLSDTAFPPPPASLLAEAGDVDNELMSAEWGDEGDASDGDCSSEVELGRIIAVDAADDVDECEPGVGGGGGVAGGGGGGDSAGGYGGRGTADGGGARWASRVNLRTRDTPPTDDASSTSSFPTTASTPGNASLGAHRTRDSYEFLRTVQHILVQGLYGVHNYIP